MEKQSRAKEFYSTWPKGTHDEKLHADDIKIMNHKTIEDVKGLIGNIDEMKNNHLKMWLIQFKSKLEELKI